MPIDLRTLRLDASLEQPAMAPLFEHATAIDLRDLAPKLRLWSTSRAMREAAARIAAAPPSPAGSVPVTFYGSGDFHHLAPLLIDATRPVTVLHFDNHPDWVRWGWRYHCGSWVHRILHDNPLLAQVVTIGPCSDDLAWPDRKGADLDLLRHDRLRMFPWQRPPTWTLRALPECDGHTRRGHWLHWNNLSAEKWRDWFLSMLDSLPTGDVHVTIDKDVLDPAAACTNWDQGQMPLEHLLDALDWIGEYRRIVGVDVCGEYSAVWHTHPGKCFESWMDQPRDEPTAAELERNVGTNRRLLQRLREVLA